jgi:hypothetical protein
MENDRGGRSRGKEGGYQMNKVFVVYLAFPATGITLNDFIPIKEAIDWDKPISNGVATGEVEKKIGESHKEGVTILLLSWQRFEDEEDSKETMI